MPLPKLSPDAPTATTLKIKGSRFATDATAASLNDIVEALRSLENGLNNEPGSFQLHITARVTRTPTTNN